MIEMQCLEVFYSLFLLPLIIGSRDLFESLMYQLFVKLAVTN